MPAQLRHDALDISNDYRAEVWTSTDRDQITLFSKDNTDDTVHLKLSPDDADSLAALLRGAANRVRARLAERSAA